MGETTNNKGKGDVLDGLAQGGDVGLGREELLAQVADEVKVGDGQQEGLALELQQVPLERGHVLWVLRPVLDLEDARQRTLVVDHSDLVARSRPHDPSPLAALTQPRRSG